MITLRRPVFKRCPYRDEADAGELVIVIPGEAPELHALGDQVDALSVSPISHEDFTARVRELVPSAVAVVTRWTTGPWQIQVTEASDEPGTCGNCGQALARCEWCGNSGWLRDAGETHPVRRFGDGGAYHSPCRDSERAALG